MRSIIGLALRTLVASALILGIVGPAHAVTPVRDALLERHATVERARAIRHLQAQLEIDLRQRIAVMERVAHS